MSRNPSISIQKRFEEEEDEDTSDDDDGGIISQFVMDIAHHHHGMGMMDLPPKDLNHQQQQQGGADGVIIHKKRKCNDIHIITKWAIVARYMEESNRKTDRLYHGALEELVSSFGVSKRTIQRIVLEYKLQQDRGIKIPDMSNKKLGTLKKKPRKKKIQQEDLVPLPELILPLEGIDAYPSAESFTLFPTSNEPSIQPSDHALSGPAESLISLAEGVQSFYD